MIGRTVFSLIAGMEERDTISPIKCCKMTSPNLKNGLEAISNWRLLHLSSFLPLYQILRNRIGFTLKDLKELKLLLLLQPLI